MNFPCFHKWNKWSDPVNGIATQSGTDIGYFRVLQMRVCDKCGIAQVRNLPQMRSIDSLAMEGRNRK